MKITRFAVFVSFFLSLFIFGVESLYAASKLDVSISNNSLYIQSCSSHLPSQIGYKGYVNGVEIFTTGVFGGFPCFSGDLFISNLNAFPHPAGSYHLVFNFYQTPEFDSPIIATFNVYFDGTSFSVFDDSTRVISLDVATSTNIATVHDYISDAELGSSINFKISTSTEGIIYSGDTVIATTTGDFYYSWDFPGLAKGNEYTFYTSIASTTVLASKSLTIKLEDLSGNSNVLFIPGLEASRLYIKKTILGIPVEDQLWEPNTFGEVNKLYLGTEGNSIITNIYTKDVIDHTLTVNIYESFKNKLNTLKFNQKINNWVSYAYDWRQGVEDIIQNGTQYENNQTISLVGTLQSLANTSQTGKVTVIAHSNGGLIAKALIKKLQDDKVAGRNNLIDEIDTLILVASPQIGTPDAFSAVLHGYKQSLPFKLMSEVQARKLAANMSSAYGLLPSKKYFEQMGLGPVAVFASTSPQLFRTSYGQDLNSYVEEQGFILGQEGRTQAPDSDLFSPLKGNKLLLTLAENLHDSIDNLIIPTSIKVIDIAGWGKETLSGITYTSTDIQPIYTMRGDHTVVSASALYGQGTKYWLDLSNSKLDHKNILEDSDLLEFINNLIDQKPLVFSFISPVEPSQTIKRLHLGVHSPVSIGAYDNEGNFTGKICDDVTLVCVIKEDIPGSTYNEFGEGKYVSLPEGKNINIKLVGTGSGTFTLNVDEFQGDGQLTGTTFKDIPVDTNTKANIQIQTDIKTLSSLKIDKNGDGVIDVNLNPKLGSIVTMPTPLTVVADNKTITLGNVLPPLTSVLSGFINGDTATTSDVTGKANCIVSPLSLNLVGTYPITCTVGTLLSSSYLFSTFIPGKLNIVYRFDGFLQPINDTGHQVGQNASVFKAGSTVPVKFQLKKADGTVIQGTGAPVWLPPQKGSSMNASIDESVYSDPATSGTTFKWESGQYIYNWSTKGLASGFWYRISVKLDDGSVYAVNVGLK